MISLCHNSPNSDTIGTNLTRYLIMTQHIMLILFMKLNINIVLLKCWTYITYITILNIYHKLHCTDVIFLHDLLEIFFHTILGSLLIGIYCESWMADSMEMLINHMQRVAYCLECVKWQTFQRVCYLMKSIFVILPTQNYDYLL